MIAIFPSSVGSMLHAIMPAREVASVGPARTAESRLHSSPIRLNGPGKSADVALAGVDRVLAKNTSAAKRKQSKKCFAANTRTYVLSSSNCYVPCPILRHMRTSALFPPSYATLEKVVFPHFFQTNRT